MAQGGKNISGKGCQLGSQVHDPVANKVQVRFYGWKSVSGGVCVRESTGASVAAVLEKSGGVGGRYEIAGVTLNGVKLDFLVCGRGRRRMVESDRNSRARLMGKPSGRSMFGKQADSRKTSGAMFGFGSGTRAGRENLFITSGHIAVTM